MKSEKAILDIASNPDIIPVERHGEQPNGQKVCFTKRAIRNNRRFD